MSEETEAASNRREDTDAEPEMAESDTVVLLITPDNFRAHRLDVWKSAYNALKNHQWHEDYSIDPMDVLFMAKFLEGEA